MHIDQAGPEKHLPRFSSSWSNLKTTHIKLELDKEAAIVEWICVCLPSCRTGFESRAQKYAFFNLYLNCDEKKMKKRPGMAH